MCGISEVGSVAVTEVRLAAGYGCLLETPQRGCDGMLVYGPYAGAGFGTGTRESAGRFRCGCWKRSQALRG